MTSKEEAIRAIGVLPPHKIYEVSMLNAGRAYLKGLVVGAAVTALAMWWVFL